MPTGKPVIPAFIGPTSRWLARGALAAATLLGALVPQAQAHAQGYVNVTVGGPVAPGVYGEIRFGNQPPPPVYSPRPVVLVPTPVVQPVYLYVPENHRHHWSHYCSRYGACGRPVYFVQVQSRHPWWDDRRGPHGHRPGRWHDDRARGHRD